MTAVNLLGFDLEGLAAYCESFGEKRFRATQLFRWVHQRGAADFAESIDANAVHGSDAAETAAVEVAFFFPGMHVYGR